MSNEDDLKQAAGKKARGKLFRQTKELINLALKDGWTQEKIAKTCRTQQSIVSAWKKGDKKASEQQVAPLLKIYGSALRRNSFRLYYSYEDNKYVFHKVEGKVIFTYTVNIIIKKDYTTKIKKPILKISIHEQGKGNFIFITQHRFKFDGTTNDYVECVQDAAIWSLSIIQKLTVSELIDRISKIAIEWNVDKNKKDEYKEFINSAFTLPFLIRKILLEHGYPVDDITEYHAEW